MAAAFPEVSKVQYEGPNSKNPLAFRWYNESEVIEGEPTKSNEKEDSVEIYMSWLNG